MRDGRVEMDWADGTYAFRLGWGELAELQEKCNAGPYVILNRLQTGEWRIEDISNVIRLGLMGAEMDPVAALKKVRMYVEARPPFESLLFAVGILSAGLMGAPDELPGESQAADPESELTTSHEVKSDLPLSTEPAQSSGTRRKRSIK